MCVLLVTYIACTIPLQAQTSAPITSSGLNTVVTASGNTYNITGGTRPGGGTNLFHSFGNFDVPNNNIANFLNESTLPTANILSRVTAGNISNIFGTVQTTGFANANLFLMNPAGFLFGPNASINVGGMVSFTSADYLRLTDGIRFNAVPNPTADAIISTAPVAAYGFLGSNPGAINVQGSQLTVTDETGISLIGGDITIQSGSPDVGTIQPAKLLAPGGKISLASVASPGEIVLPNVQSTPNTNGQSFTEMGNIALSEGTLLDVSADKAGTIQIRGGQLTISDGTLAASTINSNGSPVAVDIQVSGDLTLTDTTGITSISAQTTGTGNAGAVNISSANMIATTSNVGFPGVVMIDTHTSGSGKGGEVNIKSGNLDASSSVEFDSVAVFIDAGFTANGHGGNVLISADRLNLNLQTITTGDFISLLTGKFDTAVGSAGNITIAANDFQSRAGQIIADASTAGIGGNLNLQAKNVGLEFANVSSFGFEQGGSIDIIAESLTTAQSFIGTQTISGPNGALNIIGKSIELTKATTVVSSTGGDGNAAPINITAHDHLSLTGSVQDFIPELGAIGRPTGIFSNSFGVSGTHGNAGTITINTPNLVMTDGARINTTTASSGRGGDVIINGQSVSILGEFPSFIPEPLFNLGTIHAGGISTTTVGQGCAAPCGDAGNISITTNALNVSNGAQINSGTTTDGKGGLITINASNTITVSGKLSDGSSGGILSQTVGSTSGSGAGGNISLIAGQSISISDGATVSASTTGTGNAGNILIKSNDISISGGGTIAAASTGAGNAGTVTIQGPSSPANSFLIDGAGSGIFTNTEDIGAGGSISVDANAVTLQNGGTISASTSGGSSNAIGGNISIAGGQFVQMNNGASITASSTGPGNAGNILVDAGPQLVMQNSSIKTEAAQAGGGNIEIRAVDLVQLGNSTVSTSVLGGTGSGGNITIDPNLVLLQNSQIIAQAVQGSGGNISITTNLLLPDSASVISASSQFGQQGNIVIQSPVSPASGKLVPLGQKPLIATSLLSQRCAALSGGSISSFTVAGRDSLPSEPGGWVSSPLALKISESENVPAREADGIMSYETPLLSLRKIAPSGFLTQAFAADSSGCQS
jgi:filamentous hemagglutinin family protein